MRELSKMDTIQVEITNACVLTCANCTRFCGHQTPYFMTLDDFKKAINSLVDFPRIVGLMGGEPLLHPRFEELCEYARTRIPRERLGLWTTFPPQEKYVKLREVIVKTFGQVLLNNHTRPDIMHGPILVGIQEVIKDPQEMWSLINKCWVQNTWSASVNPKGAFFCEVAAAQSLLYNGSRGWDVEPNWWKRSPQEYEAQMREFCVKCGCGIPLERRSSQDNRDDISPENFKLLKGKSKKVNNGDKGPDEIGVVVNTQFKMDPSLLKTDMYPDQVYKDFQFRGMIAKIYGIYLTLNEHGYMEPHLRSDWQPGTGQQLYQIMVDKYSKKEAKVIC